MAIQGHKKVMLTKELILSKISEYDIFRYYMPDKKWKINEATHSPFRKDTHPSFMIGNKQGYLYFIDFTDSAYRGSCFDFVMLLYGLPTVYDAVVMIDKDFGLGFNGHATRTDAYKIITAEYKQPEELGKRYSLIQVVARKFTNEELSYWNNYFQDADDLKRENIYGIKKVYLNKQLFTFSETDLKFGYYYDGNWKIYRPFVEAKKKWVPNNVPITTMDGLNDIKDCGTAIITKSKKDYMVLKKIYPHVCAVQNESVGCFSTENVTYIKENSKRQILSFDSDKAGVKNSQEITKLFDFEYLNVPRPYLSDGITDFADLAKDYGLKKVEQILKRKL